MSKAFAFHSVVVTGNVSVNALLLTGGACRDATGEVDMIQKAKIAIGAGAVVLAIAVLKWSFTPTNYDDCVLDGMESAQTERAAYLVAKACRSKFPEKTHHISSLDDLPKAIERVPDEQNLFREFK